MLPPVARCASKITHPQRRKALLGPAPRLALTGEARKPNLKLGFHWVEAAFFFGDSGTTLSNSFSFRLGDESNPL
jgi:hypothetical protein